MKYSKEFIDEAVNNCFEYFKNLPIGSEYSTHNAMTKLYGETELKILWDVDTKVQKLIKKSSFLVEYPFGEVGIPYNVGCTKLSNEDGQLFSEEQRFGFLRKAEILYLKDLLSEKSRNSFYKIIGDYNLTHQMIVDKCIKEFEKLEPKKEVTFQLICGRAIGFIPDIIYSKEEVQSIYSRFLYQTTLKSRYCVKCVVPLSDSKYTNVIWKENKSEYN